MTFINWTQLVLSFKLVPVKIFLISLHFSCFFPIIILRLEIRL